MADCCSDLGGNKLRDFYLAAFLAQALQLEELYAIAATLRSHVRPCKPAIGGPRRRLGNNAIAVERDKYAYRTDTLWIESRATTMCAPRHPLLFACCC